jgi:hypothetical protein
MPARCLLNDPVLKSMLARSTFVHMIHSYKGMYRTYERTNDYAGALGIPLGYKAVSVQAMADLFVWQGMG